MDRLESGGSAGGGDVPGAFGGGDGVGVGGGGGLMEEGGLLQRPDAAEAPLGGDHALDEREFDFGLGLELGGDGEAEGGEIVGIFAGEQEGGGECAVL